MKVLLPKISVIVPVYKAETYLHRCVDSLLAQTFKDFEILLIDDGSPDRSGEICDEYAVKDSRVRVFHKENGGVSSARQCGIDNALGDYTIHADPDDWVESTMLEELYIKAMEEEADMVICDFYSEFPKKQIYVKQEPSDLNYRTIFKLLMNQLHGSCWNKLIRRKCFEKYGIYFPNVMNLYEDKYVMLNLTLHPIKITYLSKAFYHYDFYTNPNSVVRKPTLRDLNSIRYLISFLEKQNEVENYSDELYKLKCNAKGVAFRLGISYKDFVVLYKEINNKLISDYEKGKRVAYDMNYYMALSLNTNKWIYYLLKKLYLFRNNLIKYNLISH